MTYRPITNLLPQWQDSNSDNYNGAVLKGYVTGTSTPLQMATDTSGGTLLDDATLTSAGYPAPEGGGAVFSPHFNAPMKLSLYPTQAAADLNTGAIWTLDFPDFIGNAGTAPFDSYAALLADTTLVVGWWVETGSHIDGAGKGGGSYEVVAGGTGTADNYLYGDTAGGLQVKLISDFKNAYQAGAVGDGATNDHAALSAYIAASQDVTLILTEGVFAIDEDLPLQAGQILQGITACSSIGNTNGSILKAIAGTGFTDAMVVMSAHTAVRNIKFDGNSVAGRAIKLGASTDGFVNLIDENRFSGFTGITIQGNTPDSVVIRNNEFNGGGTGFIRTIDGSLVNILDNRFVPSGNIDFCIDVQSSVNNSEGRIVGNLLEGSNSGADLSDFIDGIILTGANNLTIETNNFQTNPASTIHNSHILLKTGATRSNIGKNTYQNKGASANDIQIDSGVLGTYISNDDLSYSVSTGLDISDSGTGTTAEIYEPSLNSFIKLFKQWRLSSLGGGTQFTFDTDVTKLLLNESVNTNNWVGVVAGILSLNSAASLDVNAPASSSVRLKVADTSMVQATDSASANELEAIIRDDAGTLQRLKLGANSSGPGGTGRAVYVDNV